MNDKIIGSFVVNKLRGIFYYLLYLVKSCVVPFMCIEKGRTFMKGNERENTLKGLNWKRILILLSFLINFIKYKRIYKGQNDDF